MLGIFNRSLLFRAGLAMGLLTALALAGMTSAVLVARSTNGQAAAVNQAGSLRMQSYRIAAALEAGNRAETGSHGDPRALVIEFEQRLRSPRLADVVQATNRESIRDSYRLIADRWRHGILPLLSEHMEVSAASSAADFTAKNPPSFPAVVGGFVADIDNLVRLLEEDAESRIQRPMSRRRADASAR